MRTNSTRITLLAPGCFSALSHSEEPQVPAEAQEAQQGRDQTTSELNDSSAVNTSTQSYEQALAKALYQNVPSLGELPIAQYRFLFDTDKKAPQHCVCAELIHLQADKDNARLLPMQSLAVTDDESNQLMHALNDLIRADGMEVIRTSANSYYLTGMDASLLDSWPAHSVANGKIADYLPRHSEAGDWRRLITEVQMLFHAHPVNEARANNRQLPINGMWFWGGAKVDDFINANVISTNVSNGNNIQLIAEDAYACGIAKVMGVSTTQPANYTLPQTPDEHAGDTVVLELGVYNAWLSGDHSALVKAKQALHDRWIAPAQQAVASGVFEEFILDGCEGQAIVEKPKVKASQISLKQALLKLFSKRKSS